MRSGPLTRAYAQSKAAIIDRLDHQEIVIANNRRFLPERAPVPAKFLAIERSRKNLDIETIPVTKRSALRKAGKTA